MTPLPDHHEAQPVPDTFRDRHGNTAIMTDRRAYPGTATCVCGRPLTVSHYLAPFVHIADVAGRGTVRVFNGGLTAEITDPATRATMTFTRGVLDEDDTPGPVVYITIAGPQGGDLGAVETSPGDLAWLASKLLGMTRDVAAEVIGRRRPWAHGHPALAGKLTAAAEDLDRHGAPGDLDTAAALREAAALLSGMPADAAAALDAARAARAALTADGSTTL
jgi:hypothetical protein